MDKKEILQKLIDYYELKINLLPEENWKEFLKENKMQYGICFCAEMVFDEVICYDEWVNLRYKGNFYYWFPIPDLMIFRSQALESLQNRLNAMKEEILIVE